MTLTALIAVTNAGTFVASVLVNTFLTGFRMGEMKSDVKGIERDVAEIKGMFVLTLKQP